jgi:hypothetical protein
VVGEGFVEELEEQRCVIAGVRRRRLPRVFRTSTVRLPAGMFPKSGMVGPPKNRWTRLPFRADIAACTSAIMVEPVEVRIARQLGRRRIEAPGVPVLLEVRSDARDDRRGAVVVLLEQGLELRGKAHEDRSAADELSQLHEAHVERVGELELGVEGEDLASVDHHEEPVPCEAVDGDVRLLFPVKRRGFANRKPRSACVVSRGWTRPANVGPA